MKCPPDSLAMQIFHSCSDRAPLLHPVFSWNLYINYARAWDGVEVWTCLIISVMENVKVHLIRTVKNQHRNYEENTSFSNTTSTTPDNDNTMITLSFVLLYWWLQIWPNQILLELTQDCYYYHSLLERTSSKDSGRCFQTTNTSSWSSEFENQSYFLSYQSIWSVLLEDYWYIIDKEDSSFIFFCNLFFSFISCTAMVKIWVFSKKLMKID